MIRLRATLELGLRHRWLGPVLILLFAVLLTLLALHSAFDEALLSGLLACVALALVVFVRSFPPPAPARRSTGRIAPRAPPRLLGATLVPAYQPSPLPPLRL